MYRQKIYVLILCERAKWASASETYICIHLHTYTINAVFFNYLWYGAINDIILTKHRNIKKNLWICEGAERASLENFQNIYIFRSWNTSVYTYTIQFRVLLLVWWYKRQFTDKTLTLKKLYICERAERVSELRTFSHFHIQQLFPSIFCWYLGYFITYFLRSQITSAYTIHAVSFYMYYFGYSTKHVYRRQFIDKTLTLRESMYYASEWR